MYQLNFRLCLVLALSFFVISCGNNNELGPNNVPYPSGQNTNYPNPEPGIVTAGEWSDLGNWEFWKYVMKNSSYKSYSYTWEIQPENRYSFFITDSTASKTPISNVEVSVKKNGNTVWTSLTDNKGKAEVFLNLFEPYNNNVSGYQFYVNNVLQSNIMPIDSGVNQITVNSSSQNLDAIDILFMVDATGSMGDEIAFLKADLTDILTKVGAQQNTATIRTSAVFYRDKGDEYLLKSSPFTTDFTTTTSFINAQNANGGGDFEEAVDTVLAYSIQDMDWNTSAKTKIIFMLLDAPPRQTLPVLFSLHQSIAEAAKKGIKLIPICASGINDKTEFLMRFLAISTNGTYVFITDDSGVGNPHQEPTVGNYQVEKLNDLITRLINKGLE